MSNGKRFDAPYNFVPLSGFVHLQEGETPDSQDRPFPDGWCGELDIELTALSDLLVSRGTERGAKGPGEARMFELNRPGGARWAIPASSVRGMVRSVVEIAAFGKMAPRTDDRRFGVRDLTRSGDFYRSRITQDEVVAAASPDNAFGATNGTVSGIAPLTRAGWLMLKDVDGRKRWVVRECKYGRIDFEDLRAHNIIATATRSAIDRRDLAIKRNILHCKAITPVVEAHFSNGLTRNANRTSYLVFMDVGEVRPSNHVVRPGLSTVNGYLVFTNIVGKNRKRDYFFIDDGDSVDIVVDHHIMSQFQEINPISVKGDDANTKISSWGFWKNELLSGQLGRENGREPGIPVFFLASAPEQPGANPQVIAIGLSQMLKLPYDHSVHDMVENTSKDHAAPSPDMAEAIFGTASDKDDGTGWRGRVTFSHLEGPLAKAARTAAPARLILNSPKPSFYPAYVEQSRGKEVCTYLSPQNDGPGSEIRGWKRYQVTGAPYRPTDLIYKPAGWADKETPLPPPRGYGDQLATRLHPVPGGTTFTGKMHVHNLRPVELGALLWALGLGEGVRGEAGTRRQNHGLGMGKPFGFGRCALRVTGGRLEANVGEDDASRAAVGDRLWQVLEAALRAFEAHMEAQYARAVARRAAAGADVSGGWHDSPQLVALRRLTDPSMHPTPHPYPALIQSGWARQRDGKTCERAEPKNEFVDAKNRGMFLAPAADNRLDRQRFPRKPAEPAKQAVLPAWLDGAQWK